MLKQDIINRIKRLEIVTRKAVASILGGEYHSVFKGQGIQFADFREYYHGDDVRNIAWNVTAKTGVTHIKTFEEERELNVILLVDVSSSNLFASSFQRKIDLSSELGAVLAFSAIKNNDRVGMLAFADEVHRYIPPKKGKKHVMRVVSDILSFNPDKNSTSLNKALHYVNMVLKRKSIIFVISDFITEEDISAKLKLLSRKHDVVAMWIYDKHELMLPEVGLVKVRDPETGDELEIDTSSKTFRADYKKGVSEYCTKMKKIFTESKVDYLMVETSADYAKAILNYFTYRKKNRR